MTASVSFEQFREEWLQDIREGNPSTTELGHRFATKLVTQWREIGDVADDIVYCDGAGDGGIDIALLDRGEDGDADAENAADGDTWYLVQSKYGKAFHGNNTLLTEGQKVIDTLDGKRTNLNSFAEGLLERLIQFRRQATERDKIVLVYATEEPLNEDQKRAMNDVRSIGRARLGPLFDVESVSIETIYQRALEAATPEQIRIPIRGKLTPSGDDLLVGSVSLLDLYAFLKAYRDQTQDLDQLYEKNVRRFLGSRGKVNRKIQETLQEYPERFGLYNNGITIVVTHFEQAGDQTTLIEPYIVNGCQTTRTIWEVFHKRLEAGGSGLDPELEAWRQKAAGGIVVTKIAKVGDDGEALLQAITRYTNSQNAVREKDFLALTSDFKTWAKKMAEEKGIFLEVQRGAWDSQRAFQKQHPETMQFKKYANAFDLLKVYGAGWLAEAGMAFSKNAPFLPNGNIFKRIVNNQDGEEPFGVDDLYAAYCLQEAANAFEFGRGAPKPSRRQTRFLFYMVTVELLKDVLIHVGKARPLPKDYTNAFLMLFKPENAESARALLDTAVGTVDDYLTPGLEDTVFTEPAYQNAFNNDLNAFLKWEKLGKSEDDTPHLKMLLAITKNAMRRGKPAPRDVIAKAISG